MKKLINIILVFALVFNFSCIFIDNVYASSTATVIDSDGLNVRSGPGSNYSKVGFLSYGRQAVLVATDKKSGTGCSGGWYQINYDGSTDRYICSDYVSVSTTDDGSVISKNGYFTTNTWGYRIAEDYTIVRSSPSTSSTSLGNLYLGTKVKVLEYTSNGWTKISYYDGKVGYVVNRLVKSYEDLTATDEDYYNELRKAGFPESYLPFLTKLHKQHPNWNFKALNVGKDFSTAVASEIGKCYTQATIESYRLNNVLVENPNWYKASPSVVAVYMDPRNYLNEVNIFAFEELAYDEKNQTSDIVKSIFGNSYLSSDQYVTYFMNAGKTYNISPVHLASRVKQEGGTNESYDGVSGNSTLTYGGSSLKGYYNYYNIGAYQDSITSSSVARGLAVAGELTDKGYYLGTPWDTREKAIMYGAYFIADSYINKGQNTMYLQKFNVANGAYFPSYTHQYMTNVMAPASEAFSTWQTNNNLGLLDTAYTFAIPVYDNMPSDFTTLPPIGNSNNYASDIKINGKTINGFDKDVLEYTHYVDSDVTSVNITVSKESDVATVSGAGNIKLDNKETLVNIKVTSQTNEVRNYKITIIKKDKEQTEEQKTIEEVLNNVDIKYSNGYMTGIAAGTTATTLSNMIYEQNPNVQVVINDKDGNAKSNSNLATGDKITITLNNETVSYKLSIKGDVNGDGVINSIDIARIQRHILKLALQQEEYKDAADTNYDGVINSIDIAKVQRHILGIKSLK